MSKAQSRNPPEKAERNASVADDDVGMSRSFVFSVLRAKERRGGTTLSKATRRKSNGDSGSPNTKSGYVPL